MARERVLRRRFTPGITVTATGIMEFDDQDVDPGNAFADGGEVVGAQRGSLDIQ